VTVLTKASVGERSAIKSIFNTVLIQQGAHDVSPEVRDDASSGRSRLADACGLREQQLGRRRQRPGPPRPGDAVNPKADQAMAEAQRAMQAAQQADANAKAAQQQASAAQQQASLQY